MKTLSIAALTLALFTGCAAGRSRQWRPGRPQWDDALNLRQ